MRVGIQGVSDGPVSNGTWLTYYDIASPASGQVTVSVSLSVAEGDRLCTVVAPISGTWDASNRIDIRYRADVIGNTSLLLYPKTMIYNRSWTSGGMLALITPRYSDDLIPPGFSLCIAHTSIASCWNSSANPLYRGNKWVAPCNCILRSLWPNIRVDASALSDYKIHVFKDTNTTPTKTLTVDAAQDVVTGISQPGAFPMETWHLLPIVHIILL